MVRFQKPINMYVNIYNIQQYDIKINFRLKKIWVGQQYLKL